MQGMKTATLPADPAAIWERIQFEGVLPARLHDSS